MNMYDSTQAPHPSLLNAPTFSAGPPCATVFRTAYGVPHVVANDFESLGFGNGQIVAEDHALLLCEHIATILGERARVFGADVTPGGRENLDSDIGHRALGYADQAADALASMSTHSRALITGFVAGFNEFLKQEVTRLPVQWRASPALRPLCEEDISALLLALACEASGRLWVQAIALARPPDAGSEPSTVLSHSILFEHQEAGPGSNGWAIGDDAAAGARSILGANPHFPTSGGLRFYEIHLTIPGHFDVAGVALLGCPTVNLGFNSHIAWTHTVSAAERFVLYRSPLEEGQPTVCRRHDSVSPDFLSRRLLEIPVRGVDGTMSTYRHSVYYTRHGPVVHVPDRAPWSAECVFSLGDANARNADVLDHWLALGAAGSLDEVQASFERWQGTAWVNLLATNAVGEALYLDGSTVPALTQAAISLLDQSAELREWRQRFGITVLPGDDDRFYLLRPTTSMPPIPRPWLRSRGVLANFNDSYRFVDSRAPLSRHSPFFGAFAKPLSLRARRGHAATRALQKPSAQSIQGLMFDTRVELASVLLDDILIRLDCADERYIEIDGDCVDIRQAIEILRSWSRHDDLDAIGAPLFRELADLLPEKALYAEPFDCERPLETPSGLGLPCSAGEPSLSYLLALAVMHLRQVGFGPEATLRQMQFVWQLNGRRCAVAGGPNLTGVLNVQQVGSQDPAERLKQLTRAGQPTSSGLTTEGYRVGFGTCWAAVIEFLDGKPRARSVLAYSQASNPDSPWHEDQARLIEDRDMKPFWFDHAEVRQHTIASQTVISTRSKN